MAKFNLPFGLNIAANDPTDTRQIVVNQAWREALVTDNLAYEGMLVYQADSKDVYVLRGTTNNDWEKISSGSMEMGEANTASNLGTGQGVFNSKVGVDLQFRSLTAGENIVLTPSATDITITSTGGGGGSEIIINPSVIDWDGTIHISDLTTPVQDTLIVLDGTDTIELGFLIPVEGDTIRRENTIIIDNSNNTVPISVINYTGNWTWSDGDPHQGVAAGATIDIGLWNINDTTVRAFTS